MQPLFAVGLGLFCALALGELGSGCVFDPSGLAPPDNNANQNNLNTNQNNNADCGNGTIDSGEECDDGAGNSDTQPDACRTTCQYASCGDGVVDSGSGEQCDDGAGNSDTTPNACRTNCQNPSCGDGVVDSDSGEQCDDGAGNSDTTPNACRTNCQNPSCGDGVVDSSEACDDGAQNSDTAPDACRTSCQDPSCGDGVVDSGEACDDGNAVVGDGCGTDCQVEAGWECSGSPSTCTLLCGNGTIEGSEQCDDGNTAPGDGCDASCQVEPHFACDGGSPSTCACVTYVNALSSASNPDGLSWSTAYTTVQEGIDDAAAQGRACEVWVEARTYDIYQTDPADTVLLASNVEVLGGFAGNEAWRADRDPETNRTILDGGGNIYHVVTADGVTGAVLSGFAIQGGDATGAPSGDGSGGGLVVLNGAELDVSLCLFQQNRARYGGGIYSESANLSLWGVVFENNTATQDGGGLYLYGAAPIMAYQLFFFNNGADSGGGAYVNGASAQLQRVVWGGNQATNGYGGGIFFDGATGSVVNGLFVGNSASSRGGAIEAASWSSVQATHCTFIGNSSGNAGSAVRAFSNSTVTLLNSILWNNPGTALSPSTSSSIDASYCDIEGGWTGTGNINQDPQFARPGNGNFHLQLGSPCVDSGDGAAGVTEDLDGLPRGVDVGIAANTGNGPPWVDMGAYEVQ